MRIRIHSPATRSSCRRGQAPRPWRACWPPAGRQDGLSAVRVHTTLRPHAYNREQNEDNSIEDKVIGNFLTVADPGFGVKVGALAYIRYR